MKKILVIGGTGTLGQTLVSQLLNIGNFVRVLSRNPLKAAYLRDSGAEIVVGDLLDKDSLLKACHGMDVVISAAHSMLGRGRYTSERIDVAGQKALIDAAKAEGVPYFIFLSVIGAAPDHASDFWRNKWQIEQYLKQSGLTYNIIRASAFMEMHIHEMLGKSILAKGKVTIFGKGENPTNFVSVKDVARLILHCLEHPEHHNQTFEIGGLDNLSRLDIVALYAQKLGKPIKITHVPNGVLRFMSKVIRPFHPGISRVMFLADLFDRTEQRFDVGPLLRVVPMEMRRVSDLVP
jgi:uncharacterized protein YbjT (DUF2867 family)